MKRKILLADYIASVNREQEPVGHSLKAYRETKRLLQKEWDVQMAAPLPYLRAAGEELTGVKLPIATDAEKSGKNTFENTKCMLNSFRNIHRVLTRKDAAIVWFYNVDQFLFMYLGMFGLHGKKIIVTMFASQYPKNYHNYFLQKVKKKLLLIVSSNPDYPSEEANCIFVPDFLCGPEYDAYRKEKKQEKAVCLGTMNRSKRIKELVECFAEIEYPLEICGYFYEQSYYEEISKIVSENVDIRNEYLDEHEYLKQLAEAEYCILPYSEDAYKNITSGVLLECIFLDTVPVAPAFLLERMQVAGIGYEKIEDIPQKIRLTTTENRKKIKEKNRTLVSQIYREEKYRKEITSRLLKEIE